MDLCSVIGANIRRLRKARGLLEEDLAFQAETGRSYLSEIENGRKNLSVVMLDWIAEALEADIKEMFKGYSRRAPKGEPG